jgi:alkylhydroperoxidase family enzyme
MLDYAVKLTDDPAGVTADDVESLRLTGFTDEAILQIVEVTAYYAFANRMADGLGIELEGFWDEG